MLVNEYITGDDSDDLSQDASVGVSLPTDSEFLHSVSHFMFPKYMQTSLILLLNLCGISCLF